MSKCLLTFTVLPSIVEKCEGCGSGPASEIKDIEVRNGTRQVMRTFLCKECRDATASGFKGVK